MKDIPENANQGCIGSNSSLAGNSVACQGCPNKSNCSSKSNSIDNIKETLKKSLVDIPFILMIMSGKGGVGKSTVSAGLSQSFSSQNYSVGLLDLDLCGPSIPKIFGVENENITRFKDKWNPIFINENLRLISTGLLLENKNDAIIWRGPRKSALIRELIENVFWEGIDLLIIDLPPGTSDEHITIVNLVNEMNKNNHNGKKQCSVGCVLVSTPQSLSFNDVLKLYDFCKKTNLEILGMIENMKFLQCKNCQCQIDLFENIGIEKWCKNENIDYLGGIPFKQEYGVKAEEGKFFNDDLFDSICQKIIKNNNIEKLNYIE